MSKLLNSYKTHISVGILVKITKLSSTSNFCLDETKFKMLTVTKKIKVPNFS